MKPQMCSCSIAACFAVLCLLTASCSSRPVLESDGKEEAETEVDRSLIFSQTFDNVENGSAFDKAVVEIGRHKKIILPDTATLPQDGDAGKLQIFMKKTLSFYGHPPESMSIRQARKNMGCALQMEKDALVVSTFGEWDSLKEGGTNLKLLIVVPMGIEVETRARLSGVNSVGREWKGKYLTKPVEVKEGYWYGLATPGEGWEAIAAVPDEQRRAQ
jgi:hypothetical protein